MAASQTQLPLTSSHVCNTSDLKRQTGSIPGQLEYTGRVIPTDHLPDFKCGESLAKRAGRADRRCGSNSSPAVGQWCDMLWTRNRGLFRKWVYF